MDSTVLKLILTPILIGSASLAGRRWGPAVSGWLIALPFTSGPIVFFLALAHGPGFARSAALGMLAGTLSQALFCLAFGRAAARFRRTLSAGAAGTLAFVLSTAVLRFVKLPAAALFAVVILTVLAVLRLMPKLSPTPGGARRLPPWDIPVRMMIATFFVVALTAAAPALGPGLTGLVSPFPIITLILAAFAGHQGGASASVKVLKGLLMGLFSSSVFFLVTALLLGRVPLAFVFVPAVAAAFAVQGCTLLLMRRFPA